MQILAFVLGVMQILAFLDTNMLVYPQRETVALGVYWGSILGVYIGGPTRGPNTNGFGSQWKIGIIHALVLNHN